MSTKLKINLTAFITGILFSIGLVLGGMTQPYYVQGFLNIGGLFDTHLGKWEPRLAFVMIGAVMVMFFVFYKTTRSKYRIKKPIYATEFNLPTKTKIDKKLIIGAIIFGIGWGLYGYCPGPAIASLLIAGPKLIMFFVFMLIGILLARKL